MALVRHTALLLMVPRIFALPIFRRSVVSVLQKEQPPVEDEAAFTTFLVISIMLVLLGGIFAGLTLGLMGQDEVYLRVMQNSGTPKEKYHANRVLDLLGKGKHWVLVTLLLSNVITNETLPIVLDRILGGGWQAVVMSTVSIVIFGEIIPQSICVRFGLQVGSLFSPFVLFLMYAMYPVAYPIALLLDWMLGEDHGTMYKKSGLKTLVHLHRTMGMERLTMDEVTIISAVLDLKEKKVSEIMTPIDAVFTLSADKILDEKTVEDIFNSGFSRIPIYLPGQPTNFIGMLLVRVLISYDPDDCLPVSHFPLATLPETAPQTSCLNILNYFQEGKSHMCVVSRDPGSSVGAIGLVTLEDVIEELIGEEIVDESDVFVDIHQRIMRDQPGPLSKRHITSYLHALYTRKPSESEPLINTSSRDSKSSAIIAGGAAGPGPSNTQDQDQDQGQGQGQSQGKGHGQGQSQTTNYLTLGATTNFQPANPAANPLDVKKPFVTIKRQNYGGMSKTPPRTSPELPSDSPMPKSPPPSRNGAASNQKSGANSGVDPNASPFSSAAKNTNHAAKNDKQDQHSVSPRSHDRLITTIPAKTKNDHPTVISSSYKSTKNGIVESIITVKGVSKTIIEPASDWDDSKNVTINETGNIEEVNSEVSSLNSNQTKSNSNSDRHSHGHGHVNANANANGNVNGNGSKNNHAGTPLSSSSRRGSRFSLWSSKSSSHHDDSTAPAPPSKSQESFLLESRSKH
ncbi:protein MAM3 [Kluyveromyces marxianus]|nr:protein MAM3 [Kluyveromyces marxianus]